MKIRNTSIKNIIDVAQKDGIIFLSYGGILSQSLIVGMTEALEKEAEDNDISLGIANSLFTVFIELFQNMMNYAKYEEIGCRKISPNGIIVISKNEEGDYYIDTQNIVSVEDKVNIEPKLSEILTMNKDEVKKRYKELRRSGKDMHEKGGGLGFLEIAKKANDIEFEFNKINEDKFEFHIKVKINKKKD